MARKLAYDRILFTTVLMLVGLGLIVVYSASGPMAQRNGMGWNGLFVKQAIAAAIGFGAMLAAMHLDYRLLKKPEVLYPILFGIFILLVMVLFSPEVNGSRRWLRIAGFSLQPSELAKLMLVPYVAYQIDKKRDALTSPLFLVPTLGMVGLMFSLVLIGKDLGTATMIAAPAGLMIFLAGLAWRHVLVGAALLVPAAAALILASPYRRHRLFAFLDPEADPQGSGFQLLQSLIATGSGGLLGLGPGNSAQKLHFLPSPHADFVFSIIGEEYGFLGSVIFIALFGVLLWRGVLAGLNAPDVFARNLAWGCTFMLVVQAAIHMSVALGMIPTTGVPLPLISHGGTAMVTSLTAAGLILNVSQHS